MQFSPKNQKGLPIDDELGDTSTFFEVWQSCV
jgi:hypothetical protein